MPALVDPIALLMSIVLLMFSLHSLWMANRDIRRGYTRLYRVYESRNKQPGGFWYAWSIRAVLGFACFIGGIVFLAMSFGVKVDLSI
jgi:hypothetical protein